MKVEPTLSKVWQVTIEKNHVIRTSTWVVPVVITLFEARKQIEEFYPKHKILEVKVMEDAR